MLDLKKYLEIERSIHDLNDERIKGVPIWRLGRTQFRWMVRDSCPFTTSPAISVLGVLKYYFRSLYGLLKIILCGKKTKALFFPHPRLFYVGEQYLERLSDPLIDASGIDDYLILERNQNGVHKQPRYHHSRVVYLDFIDVSVRLLSIIAKPFIARKYKKQIDSLYDKLNAGFHLNDDKYKSFFFQKVTHFLLYRWFFHPVIRKLTPNVVFFAPRGTFDYATSLCRQYGATTIELQHGIVIGETDLYATNEYCPEYDPDYFFVFGLSNIGLQYGMPIEKVLNIGFPYKNFIKSLGGKTYSSNVALVASEPDLTDKLITVLKDIVNQYPQYEFHIRCHPQERFSKKQYESISDCSQIQVVDNRIESFCALSQYEVVIGEISSVLFEAMSLGKRVGRLNYGGLNATETDLLHGGFVINSAEDYHKFMTTPYSDKNDSKELYSDFNIETFNRIFNHGKTFTQ